MKCKCTFPHTSKPKIKVFSFSCNAVLDAFIKKWFCLDFVIRLNKIQFTRSGHWKREPLLQLYSCWDSQLLSDIVRPRTEGFGQTKRTQRIFLQPPRWAASRDEEFGSWTSDFTPPQDLNPRYSASGTDVKATLLEGKRNNLFVGSAVIGGHRKVQQKSQTLKPLKFDILFHCRRKIQHRPHYVMHL